MITVGTTLGATRFTTEITSTEEESSGAKVSIGPADRPDRSTETARLIEATRNRAVRAASARAPSAAMTMADKKGDFRNAAAPAWVAAERFIAGEAGLVGALADIGNRCIVTFPVDREIQKWKEEYEYAASEVELRQMSLCHFR
jgi:hypothetical protein